MAFAGKDVSKHKFTGLTYKGKDIILSKTRGRPVDRGRWRKDYFTEDKRIEAATIFAASASPKLVEELTGVPSKVLRGWLREEEFKALLDDVRAENDHKIVKKFDELIDVTLEAMHDRVVNGDYQLNHRTGEMVRRPVDAKALSLVTAINIDKRQLLRGKPTSRVEKVESVSTEERLSQLARSFEQLSKKKGREPEIIDAEIIEPYQIEHDNTAN